MSSFNTRPLNLNDLEQVKNIILNWDSSENVNKDLEVMTQSLNGVNTRKYFIAEDKAQVVGVVGMMSVRKELQNLTTSTNPIEITVLFVDPKIRMQGVGTILVNKIETEAINTGRTEIILESSEPRKKLAWGFYDQLKGYKRVAAIEHSGKKYQVWRKLLN
jgi:ribosomal protein S18 acetylase RimI-like enzyme